MTVLYNEVDPFAAQWLRNLAGAGHIAAGSVDERSILDLKPADVRDATQVHCFAGVGVWSYALRLAGVPDTARIWTGSCPCQPFSAAGKRKGLADERHLWPAWFALIRECRPPVIFGEQVASAGDWLDVVSRDMEAEGYAFGAAVFGAHSVGAPHIRQRFYFVAYSGGQRLDGIDALLLEGGSQQANAEAARSGAARLVAYSGGDERGAGRAGEEGARSGSAREQPAGLREARFLGDTGSAGARRDSGAAPGTQASIESSRFGHRLVGNEPDASGAASFWSNAEWIPCRDGKLRPVEPGTFPLAHGATSRVGRLRAYGNALNAETAAAFIRAAGGPLNLAQALP